MRKQLIFIAFSMMAAVGFAQPLSLDSCRNMALRQNKKMAVNETTREKAYWEHKAAKTNYYPKVSFEGGFMHTSKSVSLLSEDQKANLSGLGTSVGTTLGKTMPGAIQQVLTMHPELAPLAMQYGDIFTMLGGMVVDPLNAAGQKVVDALDTNTKNVTAGAILVTQPLYMGGKIRAYDKITGYAEQIAAQKSRGEQSGVILDVDQAYWQVVSLVNKKKLAENYISLLKTLEGDVQKMVQQGVATKSNLLTVGVKLNEAEMSLLKVEDGLKLSRMLLCQICGLPLDKQISLEDEGKEIEGDTRDIKADVNAAMSQRAELQQLELAKNIYDEKVKIERSAFLPSVVLTGGYGFSNPAITHGFEKRFRGMWNVGVLVKVPVWNWFEGKYKVNAAKTEAKMYEYQLEEAREKIELQVNQQTFRVNEANRKYALSLKNLEKAEENLRMARMSLKEGVITTSEFLEAQTAWLSAHSDKIDAAVEMKVTRSMLNNVLGK